jgi:hypothetical protein
VVGNLPALSTPLVGRTGDLAAIGRLLGDSRLVTLAGPAGVGKTRTALEAVRALHPPGGVWLIRLEAADATSSIPQMVAEALQLTGGEQTLLDRLAGAETVLVLDNCEHVLDGVADLATRLLDQAPPLRIVATSQAPLGVDGEATYVLDPLPLSDSVALFADRATRMRRQFALDGRTAATVEAVCRSLAVCPWPSSWPRPGSSPCRSRKSRGGWTTASPCSRTPRAGARTAAGPSPPPSLGATTCCSPTTSEACGPCPALPAGRP